MRTNSLVKIFLSAIFFLLTAQMNLQAQDPVDSIHYWIDKSRDGGTVDSVAFNKGLDILNKVQLNEFQIAMLEKKARSIKEGMENYWQYNLLHGILRSLNNWNMDKAIIFGRKLAEETENLGGVHGKTIRSNFLKFLRLPYRNSNHLQEGLVYFTEKLKYYREKNDSAGMADCYYVLGGFYRTIGLLDQAIYNSKKGKLYTDSVHGPSFDFGRFAYPNGRFSYINADLITGLYQLQKGEHEEAIQNFRKVLSHFYAGENNNGGFSNAGAMLAQAKLYRGEMDSVTYFLNISLKDAKSNRQKDFLVFPLQILAEFYTKNGNTMAADSILDICDRLVLDYQIPVTPAAGVTDPDYYRALVRARENKLQEAIGLMNKDLVRLNNNRLYILRDLRLIADWYNKLNHPALEAATYRRYLGLQDSLLADQDKFRTLSFEAEQEMDAKQYSISQLESSNRITSITRNFSIGLAILLLLLAVGFYQRFRFKHKANQELEIALVNLKATQAQLVQSEKMASLGELTAGIAHEIQNPLNFVNNFSEVNTELIDELVDAAGNGDIAEVKELSASIRENESKINYHGKRADAIVKSMLQHSRSNTNNLKEPTDINALADEYLRLAYHGLRAKDKSFNATLKTDLDLSIGNINLFSQEIGRVILNLITNAFYAMTEKKAASADPRYMPTLTLSSQKINGKIELRISDNGSGIPKQALEKIFQPFFTTKPTGQGTGLGLSLSYDIVKAHGGEIKVETKEGEGTTFIILLPVQS